MDGNKTRHINQDTDKGTDYKYIREAGGTLNGKPYVCWQAKYRKKGLIIYFTNWDSAASASRRLDIKLIQAGHDPVGRLKPLK